MVEPLRGVDLTGLDYEDLDYYIRCRAAYEFVNAGLAMRGFGDDGLITEFDEGCEHMQRVLGDSFHIIFDQRAVRCVPSTESGNDVWTHAMAPKARTAWFIGAFVLSYETSQAAAAVDSEGFRQAAADEGADMRLVDKLLDSKINYEPLIEKAQVIALGAEWERIARFGPSTAYEGRIYEAINAAPVEEFIGAALMATRRR